MIDREDCARCGKPGAYVWSEDFPGKYHFGCFVAIQEVRMKTMAMTDATKAQAYLLKLKDEIAKMPKYLRKRLERKVAKQMRREKDGRQ